MGRSLNEVNLIGRVGGDPEVKYTQSGKPVANFSVATDESWKDSNGEKHEQTEWHRIVVWQKLAEIAGEYVHKGDLIYLKGRLVTRKWTDQNGGERQSTEIVTREIIFLQSKNGAGNAGNTGGTRDQGPPRDEPPSQVPGDDDLDGLPFAWGVVGLIPLLGYGASLVG